MRRLRWLPRSLFLMPVLAFPFATVLASDWPQWRGPNRDDVSTEKGLLQDWPSGGPTQEWKASGPRGGYATVSLQGGRLYTGGDRKEGSVLIALNAARGQTE